MLASTEIVCHLLSSTFVTSLTVFSKLYSGGVTRPPGLELLLSRSFAYLETNVFEFCGKTREKKEIFPTGTFCRIKLFLFFH